MSERTDATISVRKADLPDLIDALIEQSGYDMDNLPPPTMTGGQAIATKAQLARWSHALVLKRLVANFRQRRAADGVDIV